MLPRKRYTNDLTKLAARAEAPALGDSVAAGLKADHIHRVEAAQTPASPDRSVEGLRQLAAGIAHDYNNLLTAIICSAGLALDSLPQEHPLRDWLEIISNAGDQAAALTRQLMVYAGASPFLATPVDLSTLVHRVLVSLRESISGGIRIHLDLPAGLPAVWADSCQVEQLVHALITNAVEAIGDGTEGAISIRAHAGQIRSQPDKQYLSVALPCDRSYVELTVSDTGCGMDDALRRMIFDPFFSTKFMGRGLGLASVAGIVRAHRGAVRVQSIAGLGAIFRVWLPVWPEAVELANERITNDEHFDRR